MDVNGVSSPLKNTHKEAIYSDTDCLGEVLDTIGNAACVSVVIVMG